MLVNLSNDNAEQVFTRGSPSPLPTRHWRDSHFFQYRKRFQSLILILNSHVLVVGQMMTGNCPRPVVLTRHQSHPVGQQSQPGLPCTRMNFHPVTPWVHLWIIVLPFLFLCTRTGTLPSPHGDLPGKPTSTGLVPSSQCSA